MFKKLGWVLSILLIVFVVSGCFKKEEPNEDPKGNPPVVEEPKEKNYSFSLVAVGDALIHNGVYIDANTYQTDGNGYYKYDFKKMFTDIKDIVSNYDLAFYNQETVIGGKNLGLSNYPNFNSPDEIGLDLIDAGFNLVNLATNHTLDKYAAGATYSANFWKNQDVYTVGSYASQADRDAAVIKEKNGITYSMLGYTYGTNGIPVPSGQEYLVNVYNADKVKADIEKVRDKVDILIVSMHWGTEYTNVPSATQKEQAAYLASLGVDIIIGHHPHSIQPIEFIDDTLVIYSLGNFISAQSDIDQRVGMIAALTVNKKVKGDNVDIEITDVKGDLLWTYYQNYSNFKVIPFNKLNDSLLNGYQGIYTQYSAIINQYDDSVQVGFFE